MPEMVVASKLLADEEIVDRIRAGEAELYEILMRRYNERLYRITRSILRSDAEAEEVVQEAYVRAYSHLDQFAGHSKFSTWLTRIAIHEALARLRVSKRFVNPGIGVEGEEYVEQFESKDSNPEREYVKRELGDLLEELIDKLPEKYRLAFVMREVEGLSTAETATCLGVEEEAVKTRLFRARAMLRRGLKTHAIVAAPELFRFGSTRCDAMVAAVMTRIAH